LPPTLRDLGDQGQAQAISFLEKDASSKANAWTALQNALDPRSGERDPFRFDRILIATVTKGTRWKPGDRIVWTRIIVEPINFQFAGYSIAATENETLKVASFERTDSSKVSAKLSGVIPGIEGPKASLEPSSEHTVKTSSEIKTQYEKLGIDIMPHFLRIIRESETGGDAIGNTRVSLTIVTDPEKITKQAPGSEARRVPIWQTSEESPKKLQSGDTGPILLLVKRFDADGANGQSPGDEIMPPIEVLPQVPVPHCPLRARVWMLYEKREVTSGHESYDEEKQSVKLVKTAEDKQDVEIMSPDEVSPAVWLLRLCKDSECKNPEDQVLTATWRPTADADAAPKENLERIVVFTDYGVAIRLAHWLRTHPRGVLPGGRYKVNYPAHNNEHETLKNYQILKPFKVKGNACESKSSNSGADVASSMRAHLIRLAAKHSTRNP
jgi:hypothetical protein